MQKDTPVNVEDLNKDFLTKVKELIKQNPDPEIFHKGFDEIFHTFQDKIGVSKDRQIGLLDILLEKNSSSQIENEGNLSKILFNRNSSNTKFGMLSPVPTSNGNLVVSPNIAVNSYLENFFNDYLRKNQQEISCPKFGEQLSFSNLRYFDHGKFLRMFDEIFVNYGNSQNAFTPTKGINFFNELSKSESLEFKTLSGFDSNCYKLVKHNTIFDSSYEEYLKKLSSGIAPHNPLNRISKISNQSFCSNLILMLAGQMSRYQGGEQLYLSNGGCFKDPPPPVSLECQNLLLNTILIGCVIEMLTISAKIATKLGIEYRYRNLGPQTMLSNYVSSSTDICTRIFGYLVSEQYGMCFSSMIFGFSKLATEIAKDNDFLELNRHLENIQQASSIFGDSIGQKAKRQFIMSAGIFLLSDLIDVNVKDKIDENKLSTYPFMVGLMATSLFSSIMLIGGDKIFELVRRSSIFNGDVPVMPQNPGNLPVAQLVFAPAQVRESPPPQEPSPAPAPAQVQTQESRGRIVFTNRLTRINLGEPALINP